MQKFQHLLLQGELVDADHISRQTNLPEATPSERLETQEFDPTYPLPHPLDQWQHLIFHEDSPCVSRP